MNKNLIILLGAFFLKTNLFAACPTDMQIKKAVDDNAYTGRGSLEGTVTIDGTTYKGVMPRERGARGVNKFVSSLKTIARKAGTKAGGDKPAFSVKESYLACSYIFNVVPYGRILLLKK